jgi:hydrogenase maturation factor HypE
VEKIETEKWKDGYTEKKINEAVQFMLISARKRIKKASRTPEKTITEGNGCIGGRGNGKRKYIIPPICR